MSETFDLNAFIDGSSYPKKDVTVYTNVDALKRAEDIERDLTEKKLELVESEKLSDELTLVQVQIEQSALVFTLQGMPFRMAQDIANIFGEGDKAPTDDEIKKLIETTIAEVHDAKGAKSTRPNTEMLLKLEKYLSPAEFSKIVNGVFEVNFSAASYEASVDAGFPVGSSDVE